LRALALGAGFFWLLGIAGCGINPQPEPPSANETHGSGGNAGSSGGAGGGQGGHYAADPDASYATLPPATGADAGAGKRSDDFSNEDPSPSADYNGAFENIDGGAASDGGEDDDGGDGAVAGEQDDSGREQPPVPDGGLGALNQ
jgi:hypothetical protein